MRRRKLHSLIKLTHTTHAYTRQRPLPPDVVTFDCSRTVRSARYKLIYNATPHMPLQPPDSVVASEPCWREIIAAHKAGTLGEPYETLYFKQRPIMEFYDLHADPANSTTSLATPKPPPSKPPTATP